MTTTAANADVFKVSDSVRGLPDVHPGDHLVVLEDGELYLQRAVDEELFTVLGLSDALIELKYRGSQPKGDLAAVLGNATGKFRKLVDEALHPTVTPRGPERRTGRERRALGGWSRPLVDPPKSR